jgi:hypothetical protein
LIDGKWVESFGGGRVLVRRKMADGTWQPTRAGEHYFRHTRDEWVVQPEGRPFKRHENRVRMDFSAPFPLTH